MSEDQQKAEELARPEEMESTEVEQPEVSEAGAEDKPQGVPLAKFIQTKNEKKEAQRKLEEQQREIEALRQQQELMKLSMGNAEPETVTPPNPDDYYDDPQGLKEAWSKYEDHLSKKVIKEAQSIVDNKFQSLEEQNNIRQAQEQQQAALNAYYERAEALNAPDFLDVEEKLKEEVSNEFYGTITGYFDNAEKVIYALGGDLEKAKDFQQKITANPIAGFRDLIRYADSIDTKQETKQLPEPDVPLKGGMSGVANVEAKIEKLRAMNRNGEISFTELMKRKRELQAAI